MRRLILRKRKSKQKKQNKKLTRNAKRKQSKKEKKKILRQQRRKKLLALYKKTPKKLNFGKIQKQVHYLCLFFKRKKRISFDQTRFFFAKELKKRTKYKTFFRVSTYLTEALKQKVKKGFFLERIAPRIRKAAKKFVKNRRNAALRQGYFGRKY